MSIKTNFEIPRASEPSDLSRQGQRLAQDLSRNFSSIKKQLNEVSAQSEEVEPAEFVDFTGSMTISSATSVTYQDYTFTHNFGTIPSGYFIIDSQFDGGSPVRIFHPVRLSWTTTAITVRVSLLISGAGVGTGNFKIRILR